MLFLNRGVTQCYVFVWNALFRAPSSLPKTMNQKNQPDMKNQNNKLKPWTPPELTTLSISRDTEQGPGPTDPPDQGMQS